MGKKERLIEVLEELPTADLVAVHNRYCEECNYPDDHVYQMAEFEEIMEGTQMMDLVNMICYGNFLPSNDYFWFNGNGNLVSDDFPEGNYRDQAIYISDIASAMICEESGFGCDECQEIIDEEEESDDE